MHVAFVAHSFPHPSTNGAPMTSWAIVKSLLAAGHRVTVYCMVDPRDHFNTPERREPLARLGAAVVDVPVESGYCHVSALPDSHRPLLARLFRARLGDYFPSTQLIPRMKEHFERARPDVIFAYHYSAIAATHGLRLAPRMAATGDIWHGPSLARWKETRPALSPEYVAWTLHTLRDLHASPTFSAQLLNDCDLSGCFGAYDAAWLARHGAKGCAYLKSPIVDACGAEWRSRRRAAARSGKPKILLGPSNLQATSTAAGIRLFAASILPRLERELGPQAFEVHLVGEGEPPAELARVLPRPSVKLRGRIEPADSEFLSADIQLVPTPILLGVRLRIVTGFSFGCCVVAHSNEALNIPEMKHGENALLGSDGPALAREIVRAVREPELRARLGAEARRTYETQFEASVASRAIVEALERLAHDRLAAPREHRALRRAG